AWSVLDTAYLLAGRSPAARSNGVRAALQALSPARDSFLQARYFPTMLPIPAGTFDMGCDTCREGTGPVHRVQLSAFQMAKTETTWWQYHLYCVAESLADKRLMPDAPSWGKNGDHPVVNVSWADAIRYANWLNGRSSIRRAIFEVSNKDRVDYRFDTTSQGYRLPTEAEWEYVARNGSQQTKYSWGGSPPKGKKGGNIANKSEVTVTNTFEYEDGYKYTAPVGSFDPNDFGLFDMSGNVWEYCWDWYDVRYYRKLKRDGTVSNPLGPRININSVYSRRVIRGGGWLSEPEDILTAARYAYNPFRSNYTFGFRLVRAVPF
ncbi:MAG: formylglycine-generating enzyme family protein, partial [Saprospiraceae bacterium]